MFVYFYLSAGQRPIPELELGFAIAAGSLYADETFQLMKDTISAIIRGYGLGKIKYALVVFGDTAAMKIQFSDHTDVNNLLQFLSIIPKKRSGAALNEALKEAEGLFSSADIRPHARKVLVVITDLSSGKSPSEVREAARPLTDKGIKIVAVAIGKEVDPKEFEIITSRERIIIEERSVQPGYLKKEIMLIVLRGWSSHILYIYVNEQQRQ